LYQLAPILSDGSPAHTSNIQRKWILGQSSDYESLVEKNSIQDEANFSPAPFVVPEVLDIPSQYIGSVEDYTFQAYVHGERMIVYAYQNHWLGINTAGEWKKVDLPALNVSMLRQDIAMELILTENGIFLVALHNMRNGADIEDNFEIQSYFKTIPSFKFTNWNQISTINSEFGYLVKHRSIAGKWYRIKPTPRTLLALLTYAEIRQNQSMAYSITLSVKNDADELVPIAKIEAHDIPDIYLAPLYYWIQNNTVQKFGPVRTLRGGQLFNISFDRYIFNKKVKAGLKLINVKMIQWIKDANMNLGISNVKMIFAQDKNI
jgi:hypothetical protein